MNPHYSFVSARARHACEYCHAPEIAAIHYNRKKVCIRAVLTRDN